MQASHWSTDVNSGFSLVNRCKYWLFIGQNISVLSSHWSIEINTVFLLVNIYQYHLLNGHSSLQTWCQYPARDWSSGDDNTGFDQLEQQLLLWMGNINYTAEIFYIPLFLISLSPKLMLTPCYSSMFPLLEPDTVRAAAIWRTLHPGQSLTCAPGDWPSLTHELQTNVRELVASLHSLLSTLGAREEIWSVGSLAR